MAGYIVFGTEGKSLVESKLSSHAVRGILSLNVPEKVKLFFNGWP